MPGHGVLPSSAFIDTTSTSAALLDLPYRQNPVGSPVQLAWTEKNKFTSEGQCPHHRSKFGVIQGMDIRRQRYTMSYTCKFTNIDVHW